MNLVEDIVDKGDGGIAEDEGDGEYDKAEYAQKDGERVSCVVHRVFVQLGN